MTKIESPWGEEFDIILPDEKTSVKRAKKQLEESRDSSTKIPKKNKSIPLKDTLAMIKDEVLRVLGRYADNITVIRDYDEFHNYISKAIEIGSIAVDTETNNTTNTTNCLLMGLCLYTKREKQVYIPVNHVDSETFEKLENQITEEQIGFELKRLINNKTKVIMHNSTFDYEVLKYTCGVELPAYWDSMVAARLLNENEKAGLKEQYISKIDPTQEKYNITGLFKGLRYALIDPEIFAYYASSDAWETFRLYDEYQLEAFKDPDLSKVLNLFLYLWDVFCLSEGTLEYRKIR